MWERLSDANLCSIIRLYREAADLDPYNSRAFAGLSQALIAAGVLGLLHTSDAYRPAEVALHRALELDPDLIETRCSAAWLKLLVVRDWIGAEIDFDEVLTERPGCTQALVGRALLSLAAGQLSHTSELLRQASILSPLNSWRYRSSLLERIFGREFRECSRICVPGAGRRSRRRYP